MKWIINNVENGKYVDVKFIDNNNKMERKLVHLFKNWPKSSVWFQSQLWSTVDNNNKVPTIDDDIQNKTEKNKMDVCECEKITNKQTNKREKQKFSHIPQITKFLFFYRHHFGYKYVWKYIFIIDWQIWVIIIKMRKTFFSHRKQTEILKKIEILF